MQDTAPCAVRDMTRDMIDIASVLRVHAHGPWAGGDGPAARRPLRLPPRPLLRCALAVLPVAAHDRSRGVHAHADEDDDSQLENEGADAYGRASGR